ncbi:GNAT family protein [Streptomyces sp. NPDC089795]|uniref:GNAT family N-acetyltransferase n=1 Tax=Streptomyces sp. NPDC089795 TaxID=3155297 RepID=UPI00344997B1
MERAKASGELVGERVRLEPLEPRHHDALCEAVRDGSLWELAVTTVPHPDDVRGFIEDAMAARAESRAAISGLGATHEGVLRQHMVMRDGWIRDTAVYSITRPEWPRVKRALEARRAARADAHARE